MGQKWEKVQVQPHSHTNKQTKPQQRDIQQESLETNNQASHKRNPQHD